MSPKTITSVSPKVKEGTGGGGSASAAGAFGAASAAGGGGGRSLGVQQTGGYPAGGATGEVSVPMGDVTAGAALPVLAAPPTAPGDVPQPGAAQDGALSEDNSSEASAEPHEGPRQQDSSVTVPIVDLLGDATRMNDEAAAGLSQGRRNFTE